MKKFPLMCQVLDDEMKRLGIVSDPASQPLVDAQRLRKAVEEMILPPPITAAEVVSTADETSRACLDAVWTQETVNRMLKDKNGARRNGVILLDEFEKAAPSIFVRFLDIFDEGKYTDNQGKSFNLRNIVFVITTNLGVAELMEEEAKFLSGTTADEIRRRLTSVLEHALKVKYSPEFINRISNICPFLSISPKHLEYLIPKMLKRDVDDFLKEVAGCTVEYPDGQEEFTRWVIATSFSKANGMRPVRRFIERTIVGAVVKELTLREAVGMSFQGLLVHIVPQPEGLLSVTLDPTNVFTHFPEGWAAQGLELPWERTYESVLGSPISFGKNEGYGPKRWAAWYYRFPPTTSPALPTQSFSAEFLIPKNSPRVQLSLLSFIGQWSRPNYSTWGVKVGTG
jgi:hypothetical protein